MDIIADALQELVRKRLNDPELQLFKLRRYRHDASISKETEYPSKDLSSTADRSIDNVLLVDN